MAEITFAQAADMPEILTFLDAHWQKGHIFTKDAALFEWQHCLPDGENVSFVVGRQDGTGEILGLLGFVPVTQYDPKSEATDLTLATWKVRDDCQENGLGIFLFKALIKKMKPGFVGVAGLSDMVVPIYRALRFETGIMSHHVFFNRELKGSSLIDGWREQLKPAFEAGAPEPLRKAAFQNFEGIDQDFINRVLAQTVPRRSATYLQARYADHPHYQYKLSIAGNSALFIWRRVQVGDASCLRVVDYFGDPAGLEHVGGALQKLLVVEQADYLDIVHVGLDGESLERAGFIERAEFEELVVPHYFEPFERRNVSLDYAMRVYDKSISTRPILLRGFTDQDRPNQMSEGAE